MTAILVDENPLVHTVPPTFSALYQASGGLPQASIDEQDVVFFGPPVAADRLVGHSRTVEHPLHGDAHGTVRVDRTTEYRDITGHLVAEVYVSGTTDNATAPSTDHTSAAVLADYATATFGAESVRRFRTRITAPSDAHTTASLACTSSVVAEYDKDDERVADVVLTATDRFGTVAARAWATLTTSRSNSLSPNTPRVHA